MINATHLNLITGGTDSERSDTYGITMGPQETTEALVSEYREIRTKALRSRSFPTMAQRKARSGQRTRSIEIYRALQARGYDITKL